MKRKIIFIVVAILAIIAVVVFLIPVLTQNKCESLKETCTSYAKEFSNCQNNSDCVVVSCRTCGICTNTSALDLIEDYEKKLEKCGPVACVATMHDCRCVNNTCKGWMMSI